MSDLTHIDDQGRVRMVDVTEKKPTSRTALAQAVVHMSAETFQRITDGTVSKGNVIETARIAGVMAAKKTADLIPMCHPLNLTHVQVDFFPIAAENAFRIEGTARIVDQTGVEMEALTAVSVAALTLYDMCKAIDKAMTITDICLLKKSGGKSGTFIRHPSSP
ncbi:cyclic pyranopterin monophosphate synthase MoaC [Desulfosarcina ovata subsp. sediminis]|uniref:Cyclic pyranopterin monophosphate synthase n=1 Tax=Desulfosarcina ovata subsp. sediminis TaxID=885957 RepID=A0A5K7ZV49_9BACT|nr:cyclic pyranopterin monophosphate synthase MoaC [Desulfosarcina ovata]BBO84026.1 cyclic pyranopterin monophosphate synthase MoaC [Desulfosarcina ovata subsp. sediminis]